MFSFRSLFLAATYFALASALTNVTVDDETGDEFTGDKPTYTPSGSSGNWEQGANCTGCLVKPDASKAFGGTWHDATHGASDLFQKAVEIDFTGTAVYAFFICANTVPDATTLTNLTFALDGTQVGTFVHEPKATTDYEYNVPGYVNASLSKGKHQFIIQTTGDQNNSLILFDYLIYSTNQDLSTTTSKKATSTKSSTTSATSTSSDQQQSTGSSSKSNTGTIVGAVVAVAAVAVLAVFGLLCWRRRRTGGGMFSRQRKRADVNLDEEGSDYSLQGAAAAMPYTDHADDAPQPNHPAMAESRYNMPTSEYSGISRPTMASTASASLAVQNPDGSDVGRNIEGGTASAVAESGGAAVVAAASGPMRKARERQTEIARQVEEMQQRVALLRSRTIADRQAGSATSGSVAGSSTSSEAGMRNQIAALQAEVERLQSQQEYFQQLGWGDEPPPEYVENVGGSDGHGTAPRRS